MCLHIARSEAELQALLRKVYSLKFDPVIQLGGFLNVIALLAYTHHCRGYELVGRGCVVDGNAYIGRSVSRQDPFNFVTGSLPLRGRACPTMPMIHVRAPQSANRIAVIIEPPLLFIDHHTVIQTMFSHNRGGDDVRDVVCVSLQRFSLDFTRVENLLRQETETRYYFVDGPCLRDLLLDFLSQDYISFPWDPQHLRADRERKSLAQISTQSFGRRVVHGF